MLLASSCSSPLSLETFPDLPRYRIGVIERRSHETTLVPIVAGLVEDAQGALDADCAGAAESLTYPR